MEEKERLKGQLLRHYRIKSGLTQIELAKEVGVAGSYITMLERGQRAKPSDAVVSKLIVALKLDGREKDEFAAIMLDTPLLASVKSEDLPSSPLLRTLAHLLKLPAHSSEARAVFSHAMKELSTLLAGKGYPSEMVKEVDRTRLLGMGYFSTAPGKTGKRAKPPKPATIYDLEGEIGNYAQAMLDILRDRAIPVSKRRTLAKELVSFAKWKLYGPRESKE